MNANCIPTTTAIPRWIIVLCLLISLVGIADHDLWTPDEPREAAIMLSMSRTGNLLIPDLAGVPFVEKPPLYYIVGAGALRLLGPVLGPTTALRLTSALWGLGALAMTWLLARRLLGHEQGVLAMVLLATMPGFIHVTHWMLVDNALLFFVTAALWCFTEAYIGSRLGFLPWAAVFTGGAFLSKGFIGPLIILLGWLALVFSWGRQVGWRGMSLPRSLGLHAGALILCLALMLSWMIALRIVGGPDLWNEWFWTNHVGRFSGGSTQLGHMRPPWYYLPIIPVYLLPWLVIVLVGIKNLLAVLGRRQMTPAGRVLAAWALGGLLVLSITATKRDIYLSVLLPAFAMIGAQVLYAPMSRKLQNTLWLWVGCMLVGLLVFIVAPLLGPQARLLTGGWGWYQVIAGLTAIGCLGLVYMSRIRATEREHVVSRLQRSVLEVGPPPSVFLLLRSGVWRLASGLQLLSSVVRRPSFFQRVLAATALFYIGGLTILCPMVDRAKSYGSAFRAMADCVAANPSTHVAGATHVAGWRFDETTRAGFYYYCDLVFPALSDINDLNQVLERRHSRFDGVLALSRNFPPKADPPMEGPPQSESLPPWRVCTEVRMGPRRVLQLIEGARQTADDGK
ncbi:MAG: glycosyltransferase family 39 protein [Verrucomicrobia bacterium]|nr:glycosyltransferase family 39 protein [Verrucomicrobiota bacterium]